MSPPADDDAAQGAEQTPGAAPPGMRPVRRVEAAEALYRVGVNHHNAGNLEAAAEAYGRSLSLMPDAVTVYNNLGAALNRLGSPDVAVPYYKRAIAAFPDNQPIYGNLSRALRKLGRTAEAEYWIKQALRLDPGDHSSLYTLGLILRDQGRLTEARECYDLVARMTPDHPDSAFEAAYTTLVTGDLRRGFIEYEWRWRMPKARKMRHARPRWDGKDPAGRKILVRGEQGFGDNIQFARYAPMLADLGAEVTIECNRHLYRLFTSLRDVTAVSYEDPLPEHEVWVPILSLPTVFGTDLDSIPAEVPYLRSPDPVPALNKGGRLHVGLAWQGSPSHFNDHRRSVDLEALLQLVEIPNIVFVSLQKGPAGARTEALHCAPLIRGQPDRLGDFADTARVMAHLDLVISVDTSVCHLAGALGRPVWVLMPDMPDWRWLLDRPDSPWYPTMRLFRQGKKPDWRPTLTRIRLALMELASRWPPDDPEQGMAMILDAGRRA